MSQSKKNTKTSAFSHDILNGTTGILLFNGLYTFILSVKYISRNFENNKQLEEEIKNDYFTVIPVLLNKFYYFTLIYFCLSFKKKKKKLEVISGATLISFYIIGFNFIISLILYISPRDLIIIQLVFSSFIALFWLIVLIACIIFTISDKSIMNLIMNLSLFLCRFFIYCCSLFFIDEERNCICCQSTFNDKQKENKEKENEENNLKEDLIKEKKEEEKVDEEKKEE